MYANLIAASCDGLVPSFHRRGKHNSLSDNTVCQPSTQPAFKCLKWCKMQSITKQIVYVILSKQKLGYLEGIFLCVHEVA